MSGEIAISEAPIASSGDSGTAAVTVFHTVDIPAESLKFRYGERYISEAANKKFLGLPRGVYLGFTPSFAGNQLHLDPDLTYGVSLARLVSQDDPDYTVDVLVDARITLDFTGHVTYPVFVALCANGKFGSPHSAEIRAQVGVPNGSTELLLCVVTSPSVVAYDDPVNRSSPFAHASAPLGFGFMKDGAVEELLDVVDLVNELQAARTDLSGVVHSSLEDRLAADASGTAIAARLGKEIMYVQGIDVPVGAPASSFNVSASFSGLHRGLASLDLATDFQGFASEDRLGAITGGALPDPVPTGAASDTTRNVCAVVKDAAGNFERLSDETQAVAYGKLTLDEIVLSGSLQFSLGSTTVVGTGSLFLSQVQVDDIVEAPNGEWYAVQSISSDTQLDLAVVSNVSNTIVGPVRRRFILDVVTRSGADDNSVTPFSVPVGTIRFYFQAWFSTDVARFDPSPLIFRHFEPPPVSPASASVLGRAAEAAGASGAKAGAVYGVQQQGSTIGNNIHTINFLGVANAGGGVADVTQRGLKGDTGPAGSGGAPGPAGPQGPQGVGITKLRLFDESILYDHATLGPGAVYSHQYDFGNNTPFMDEVLFLSGGLSEWNCIEPGFVDANDYFDITNITLTTNGSGKRVVGTIFARVPTNGGAGPVRGQTRLYLSAGGR